MLLSAGSPLKIGHTRTDCLAQGPPRVHAAYLQALGLKSGWHTAAVMGGVSTKVHAVRLAQGNDLQLEVRGGRGGTTKGDSPVTHMQLDGEPWPQDLPANAKDPPLRVRRLPV